MNVETEVVSAGGDVATVAVGAQYNIVLLILNKFWCWFLKKGKLTKKV